MKKTERVNEIVDILLKSHLILNGIENIEPTGALYYIAGYDKNVKVGDLVDALEIIKTMF